VDARKLQSLKTDFDLLIVEDCAQSIGAYSHGNQVGGVGQMSATSFYPTKNLGCMGDGGAIFTNDQQLADLSKKLRDYGQSQKYVHAHLGLNSRLDELQAAILRDALLPKLGSYTEIRRKIAAKYCAEISNPRIAIVKEPPNSQSVWHLFPVLISEDRESFQNHLSQKGISCGVHYPILITAQPALGSLRQDNSCYPAAHAMTQQEVSLPIHPYLTETHIGRVIEACNSW
jgi:dTDP-4-amino-4,6-dideoxygalactose transaminase